MRQVVFLRPSGVRLRVASIWYSGEGPSVASLGFKEIAGILREEIETGEFRPGALVPSETTLCARWGVSRTTIRRALGILEAESLITAIPGRGRVVKSTSEPAAMEGEGRAAFIARVLREDFLRGEVSNGALTSSTAVAERFAVSEATARDALKALSADGLITHEDRDRHCRPPPPGNLEPLTPSGV